MRQCEVASRIKLKRLGILCIEPFWNLFPGMGCVLCGLAENMNQLRHPWGVLCHQLTCRIPPYHRLQLQNPEACVLHGWHYQETRVGHTIGCLVSQPGERPTLLDVHTLR